MHIRRPTTCEKLWQTKYGAAHRNLFQSRLERVIKHTSEGSAMFHPPQVALTSLRAAVNMSKHWAESVVYFWGRSLDQLHRICLEVEVWMIVDEKSKQKETQKV